jgi:hypothetical protein
VKGDGWRTARVQFEGRVPGQREVEVRVEPSAR